MNIKSELRKVASPAIAALVGAKKPLVVLIGYTGQVHNDTVTLYPILDVSGRLEIPVGAIHSVSPASGASDGLVRLFVESDALVRVVNDVRAEDLRNVRQMHTDAFQNFDEKANQLFNQLSSIVRTMNELRGIGAGQRAGL